MIQNKYLLGAHHMKLHEAEELFEDGGNQTVVNIKFA